MKLTITGKCYTGESVRLVNTGNNDVAVEAEGGRHYGDPVILGGKWEAMKWLARAKNLAKGCTLVITHYQEGR